MNTAQNYVGRDSHANAVEQTDQNVELTIDQAEARLKELEEGAKEAQALLANALPSLQTWAQDTLTRAEKGRFLAVSEKRDVRERLTNHLANLNRVLATGSTSINSANGWIKYYFDRQAELNCVMSWYELAPYPIPDSIQPEPIIKHDRQSFRAFHNMMSPMIQENDEMSCVILDKAEYHKIGGVVVVLWRPKKRGTRKYSFGRVWHSDSKAITLGYDHPDYQGKYQIIPLQLVLFVLKVEQAIHPSTPVK